MQPMWRVAFEVPEAMAPLFAEIVEPHMDAVATFELQEGGNWLIEGTSHAEPDGSRLSTKLAILAASLGLSEPALTIEPIAPIDWVTQTYLSFPPIRVGRFFVHGSHHKTGVPAGCVGLQIEAAMAFGSGEHATTQGCLKALDDLSRSLPLGHALDMGCGSGILGFAIAKLWRVPVLGVDIDDLSVEIAAENAVLNRVAHLVDLRAGNGYATPEVRRRAPFDLIVANILAKPLARMAPQLRRHLAPGGTVVLSGLLRRQENMVLAAHRAQGLRLVRRYRIGDWSTLVLRP
ncbi:50S ribosomal protein L11 methyltransferase [Rhodocista pekingensis]|uniref:Ribosomal protein L11 methyltransferase n=1 Tax=Rhodocista pekingensis TaxID=201185 RepID=A0ABW2KVZ3_9PROT